MKITRFALAAGLSLIALAVHAHAAAAATDFFEGPEREAAFREAARLEGIQARFEPDLMKRPGVYALGIGLDRPRRALVFVVSVDERGPVPPLPASLEGVPLRVERGLPPTPEDCPDPDGDGICHNEAFSLPVEMGNSGKDGNTCSGCTMGFRACDLGLKQNVWVTNAHCTSNATTCPGSANPGDNTYHPSPTEPLICALTSVVGQVSTMAPPICGGAATSVDAASIATSSSQAQITIRDLGVPSAVPGTVMVGDAVRKSGRTTGLRFGTVVAINLTTNTIYNCCAVANTMTDQFRVDGGAVDWSLPGDSGSAVVNHAVPPEIVGLHYAGSGFTGVANEIGNVLARLNLSLNPFDCIELCPANEAAERTREPARTLTLLHKLRDEVFSATELGKTWTRLFYQVTPSWLALYAQRPQLLRETAASLEANLDIVAALASGKKITITRARFDNFETLLAKHATAAGPGELRTAFERLRREINTPAVQAQFGVTVAH